MFKDGEGRVWEWNDSIKMFVCNETFGSMEEEEFYKYWVLVKE